MLNLVFSKQATKKLKFLEKGDVKIAKDISQKIKELTEEPLPDSCIRLKGYFLYRVRVSFYRIIYEYKVENDFIFIIEKRDKVYDLLKNLGENYKNK